MYTRQIGRRGRALALVLCIASALLAGSGTAKAAAIIPISVVETGIQLFYEDGQPISSFAFDPTFPSNPVTGTLDSTIGVHSVTADLKAVGFKSLGDITERRVLFRFDFEITEATAYELNATLTLEQEPIGGTPAEYLGDAGIELSYFDAGSALFLPLHGASGVLCSLPGPPCDASGAADSVGGFEFVLSRSGSLAAGIYRLEAQAKAWGSQSCFLDCSDGTAGHAQSAFEFALVPEPSTGGLMALGVAWPVLRHRRRRPDQV